MAYNTIVSRNYPDHFGSPSPELPTPLVAIRFNLLANAPERRGVRGRSAVLANCWKNPS